mgnify:FL=1
MDSTGRRWERRAERFLRGHGLTIIARNFSAKCGEIDLVMRDHDQVAFIEVRYRGRSRFGDATSSVTLKKQQKIVRCAQLFLQKFPKWAHHPCRFDVIAYDSGVSIGEPVWIRAAFQ